MTALEDVGVLSLKKEDLHRLMTTGVLSPGCVEALRALQERRKQMNMQRQAQMAE